MRCMPASIDYDSGSWPSGPGGFGFGDGDDNTIISRTSSVYIRKEFNILDTSIIETALLHMDYDDGFVAYLNGVEIARVGIGTKGKRPSYNELASGSREAKIYLGLAPEAFTISKKMLNNLKPGKNVLCIQVHNFSTTSADLSSSAFLSLGITDASKHYRPVPSWFDLSSKSRHTNFKISPKGEKLVLSNGNGNIIDSYFLGNLQNNHSVGRKPDGSNNWCLFNNPSPDSSNNNSACYDGYEPDPIFSVKAGFYLANQTVSLYSPSSSGIIRYTLDGEFPKSSSPLYTTPIPLSSTKVVSAKCYSSGNRLPSNSIKQTYFINETGLNLPVFSITMDPADLWDHNTGMYVMGPDSASSVPHYGANFWKDWEKLCHIEYFDKNKVKQFELDAGLKIHGGYSRAKPQKSFRVVARAEYGTSWIEYQLIPEKPHIKSFKRLNLRNGGSDYAHTRFRDAFMQRILKDSHVDRMGYEPALVFLNGEYWGHYEIREKQDEKYIESNKGVPEDQVDLLIHRGGIKALAGSADGFYEMHASITAADPQSSSFYSEADKLLDLENFADYFIGQTYYSNEDWLPRRNNVKFWKPQTPGGRWRYVFWDLDQASGLYGKSPSINRLPLVINPVDPNQHSDILRRLLDNTRFKNYFINRYADLMNTVFQHENIKKVSYAMRDSIESSMHRHCERWGEQNYTSWYNYVDQMVQWHAQRLDLQRGFIEQQFNLTKQVNVTLETSPVGAGRIKISTIIPDSLPWKGVYYDGVPVTMTVIPNPGFTFDHWGVNGSISDPDYNDVITLNINSDDTFTAYFSGSAINPKLTFSEINYHSDSILDSGDWVELHNYDNIAINLTGWYIKDLDNANMYPIPFGTVIQPGAYIVFSCDTSKFIKQHPNIRNYMGQLPFSFKNSGDQIRLFKYDQTLFLSATYSDSWPWPKAADGKGRTLELKDPGTSLDLPSNWFTGCVGGSPGTGYNSKCLTGIEELTDELFLLKIWPNPSGGLIKINIVSKSEDLSNLSFAMYDFAGKEVKKISSIKNKEIELNKGEFSQGIYIVKIGNEKHFLTQKIIFH